MLWVPHDMMTCCEPTPSDVVVFIALCHERQACCCTGFGPQLEVLGGQPDFAHGQFVQDGRQSEDLKGTYLYLLLTIMSRLDFFRECKDVLLLLLSLSLKHVCVCLQVLLFLMHEDLHRSDGVPAGDLASEELQAISKVLRAPPALVREANVRPSHPSGGEIQDRRDGVLFRSIVGEGCEEGEADVPVQRSFLSCMVRAVRCFAYCLKSLACLSLLQAR